MSTSMLLIHTSKLIRKMMTNHAHSELSDVVVETAGSPASALRMLGGKTYDFIISGLEMPGTDGLDLFQTLRESEGPNRLTPFIILTATDSPEQRNRLLRGGVSHFLFTPRAKEDLARIVFEACNPREKRGHARHSIPGTLAIFHMGDEEVTARVINLSLSGILCEQTCQDVFRECFSPVAMDVLFPEEYGNARAQGIMTAVLRHNVMSWDSEDRPALVRVARRFTSVPEEAWGVMFAALDKADQDMNRRVEKIQAEDFTG